jgi:hypothetical protein
MYDYNNTGTTGVDGDTFEAVAQGDLDADGTLSTFKLEGVIRDRTVVISPTIGETSPDE